MITVAERLRRALFGEQQSSSMPIPKAEEVYFPLAKTDFKNGVVGIGGQALHNAQKDQWIVPGDALRLTLVPPKGSSIAERPINVYYVGPADPFFDPGSNMPKHVVYTSSLYKPFTTVDHIGEWEIVEKEVPTYVRRDIDEYLRKK